MMGKRMCGVLLMLFALTACDTGTGSAVSSPAASDKGTPAATKAAQVLLDVQGSGIKDTQKFTAGGDWDLNWSYDCTSFGSQGNFAVTLFGKNSSDIKGVPVNQLGTKGTDVSHEHDTGTFYLSINSECAWHVTVKG